MHQALSVGHENRFRICSRPCREPIRTMARPAQLRGHHLTHRVDTRLER